jgi:predicted glycosyl hydrolase (DUF1957 family)
MDVNIDLIKYSHIAALYRAEQEHLSMMLDATVKSIHESEFVVNFGYDANMKIQVESLTHSYNNEKNYVEIVRSCFAEMIEMVSIVDEDYVEAKVRDSLKPKSKPSSKSNKKRRRRR